ncbi:PhoPQ-activated pathogenicity-related protein [Erwinia toletana]|uniref:PhoPQ-activated pathogenicity-related protein n=1 Tax=Winslowiella toletana TaxID=92490 RepID=A0ABS4P594_9GAMM|nr:PhoPQ-activated protein PqaA family protein [Winslowiella toletana]MBP2167796.1 PhoPQ-activated pathogenicity-related protein [Winslowiella toletana]
MLSARCALSVALFMISATSTAADLQTICPENKDFNYVLSCYRQKLESLPLNYKLIKTEQLDKVELRRYQLTSQSWPEDKSAQTAWQHEVDIYIPQHPLSSRALVFINNGINHNINDAAPELPSDMSEASLASLSRQTQTIVISLSNIPNQYLTLPGDNTARREDDLVAVSWSQFLQDPENNTEMPLHIPMTAAVSQSMSLAVRELTSWHIDKFIVAGISKRGWTTWLTLLSDSRVDAIVPMVFDLPDIRPALTHMYHSYGNNWPAAFYPYYMQNIDTKIATASFARLMKILDPMQYSGNDFFPRLSVAKYIINASGDDFYVPDNTRFYYDHLPGVKSLRVVANSGHYDIKKYAESSLAAFTNRLQHNKALPVINTQQQKQKLLISFSEKPETIKRWSAVNLNARDFRYACGIRYTSAPIKVSDNIEVTLNRPQQGWEASYVEATFSDGYVATTRVYITPDEEYPTTAPTCLSLPGRGLGDGSLSNGKRALKSE